MGNRLARVLGNALRVALGGLLACALPVVAQTPAPYYSANRTHIPAPHVNGTWTVDSLGNTAFEASKRYNVPAPYGKSAAVDVTAKISTRAGIKFATKVLGALPIIGTGIALWEFFNQYGVTPNGAGGYVYTPSESQYLWRSVSGEVTAMASAIAACTALIPILDAAHVNSFVVKGVQDTLNNPDCYVDEYSPSGDLLQVDKRYGTVQRYDNPNAGGSGTPIPQTIDEVTDRLMADAGPRDDWKDALDDALNRDPDGLQSDGTPEASNIGGPVQGPSEATTGPNGTTTKERSAEGTPGPGGVDWKETTTTTVRDGQGNVTSTETTTVEGNDEPPPDPCDEHPERVGCMPAGETPDVDVPEEEVTVTITPTTGWGAENASCPPPRTFTVSGNTFEMSFQPVCDFATVMRYVILAVAWIGAAFIVVGHRND